MSSTKFNFRLCRTCSTRTKTMKSVLVVLWACSVVITIATVFALPSTSQLNTGNERFRFLYESNLKKTSTGSGQDGHRSSSNSTPGTHISKQLLNNDQCCLPWPLPRSFKQNRWRVLLINRDVFTIDVTSPDEDCEPVRSAVQRYLKRIQDGRHDATQYKPAGQTWTSKIPKSSKPRYLKRLTVTMEDCPGTEYPYPDESYSLEVGGDEAILESPGPIGALRGLETFTQLIGGGAGTQVGYLFETLIEDWPRFPHRGLMIDSARHFLDLDIIKKTLDAMEMNKMNVLHWHLTDDQSFPFASTSIPELAQKGAFSPKYTYSPADLTEIVEYARVRGIRVMAELDTPAHTGSWRGLERSLMDNVCSTDQHGLLNLTSEFTFEVIEKLFQEVLTIFSSSSLVHLGGDEIPFQCRSDSKTSQTTHSVGPYFKRLQELIQGISGKDTVVWADLLQFPVELDPNTVLHVWNDQLLDRVLQAVYLGHSVLYSKGWYLDDLAMDWRQFYQQDPTDLIPDSDLYGDRLIGGEACMFGEMVDSTNLLQTVWPRAAAVAERLWSAPTARDVNEAEKRLIQQHCRMRRNGISSSPILPRPCVLYDV